MFVIDNNNIQSNQEWQSQWILCVVIREMGCMLCALQCLNPQQIYQMQSCAESVMMTRFQSRISDIVMKMP